MKIVIAENGVITEEALLAYLHDRLSPEDRHELEALLKDDPFAQEALEGLKNAPNKATIGYSLLSVRKKVNNRLQGTERKTVKIHWTNYMWAAVILGLLVSLGAIMVTYFGRHSENAMAMKEQQQEQVITEPKKVDSTMMAVAPAKTDTVITQPSESKTETANNVNVSTDADSKLKTAIAAAPHTDTTLTALANKNKNTDDKKKTNTTQDKRSDMAFTDRNTLAAKQAKPTAMQVDEVKQLTSKKEEKKAEKEKESTTTTPVAVSTKEAMNTFYKGDYKTSATQFEQVLKQQPDDQDALFFAGVSTYVNGDLKQSEAHFNKLLSQHKKFQDGSKWYKANILLKQGKKDEAKKILEELSKTGGSYKERAEKKLADGL